MQELRITEVGNVHRVEAEELIILDKDESRNLYLIQVPKGGKILHGTHGTLLLPAGATVSIALQQEEDLNGVWQRVAD